jgi:HK97 family phage portal protein
MTADTALSLATYYACVRNISEDIGKLPLLTYRRLTPRGKERAPEHPRYALLHDAPNTDMSAMDLKQLLTFWALSWGNGYAEIVRDGRGEIVSLFPIHPSRVTPRRDETHQLVYDISTAAFTLDRRAFTGIRLQQEEVFHLKGFSADGLSGYSVFRIGAESLGLARAAQTFGAAFFGNGARLSGILEHPGTLSDAALRHLKDDFTAQYGGPENAGKTGILEEGMKYVRLGIPPEEAQYLETRRFEVEDIARWFRMPLHKIQDLTNAHFSNIEEQNLEYVSDTLLPWMVRWEQESKRKLFQDEPDIFAEFLVLGLLRGDQAKRSEYYVKRFGLGTLSPDDIRELENENPLPDGQGSEYFIASNNYTPLKAALRMTEPSSPAPQPFPPTPPARNGSNGHAKEVWVAP